MKRLAAVTALFLLSCGPEKAKIDLGADDGHSLDTITPRTLGNWQEVQTVESDHDYTNNHHQSWTINGSPSASQMLVVFERFELETGYDYVTITDGDGGQRTRRTGNLRHAEVLIQGNEVVLTLDTDYSVTDWGFRAIVFEPADCVCPQVAAPVCGVDGNTYSNACSAGCSDVQVAHNSPCQGSPWITLPRQIESPHDYPNNYDNTWTVSEGGARFIRLHFSRIEVEKNYDFLTVEDGAGNLVARYTGQDSDVLTPAIAGDTAVIRLVSDYSVRQFGFEMDYYGVIGGCFSDADCTNGNVCDTNVQCIRAPCFSLCAPPANPYLDVTSAQLEADPTAYDGRAVRVVDEPHAGPAACTRRGCSPQDPCCNTCSAALVIGQNINLERAGGSPMGCRGNECNWEGQCDEFPAQNGGRYEFLGTFSVDRFGSTRLTLDSFAAAECQPEGCSGELCSNSRGLVSPCVFLPEFACYSSASCEAQSNGHCGWTQTPELLMCIDNARAERFAATDVPMAIPDNDPSGVASALDVTSSGPVGQMTVSVRISHTYRGDLLVTLVSPSGQRFPLHRGSGGSNDNLILTDAAVDAAAGVERNGRWSLEAVDRYRDDTGVIEQFEVAFQ